MEAAAAGRRASEGNGGEDGAAPALPPTADEADAAARLAAEAEAARALEADIAAAEAEAASLVAAAAADDAAADALLGEAERLGGGSSAADASSTPASSLPAAGRLAAAAAWCDEAAALVSALAGVEVECVEADGVSLTLRSSADMCDGGGDREGDGPPRAATYALRLAFATGTDTLVSATLSPPDVDLSGAVAAAVAASAKAAAAGGAATARLPRAPASALVHEALALTSARLRRVELLDEASAAHALASVSAPPGDLTAEAEVVAVLRCGVEARVRIPPLWPRTGGLALVALTPPRSDTDLSAAKAKLEGADLAGGSLCGLLSAAAAACEGVVG